MTGNSAGTSQGQPVDIINNTGRKAAFRRRLTSVRGKSPSHSPGQTLWMTAVASADNTRQLCPFPVLIRFGKGGHHIQIERLLQAHLLWSVEHSNVLHTRPEWYRGNAVRRTAGRDALPARRLFSPCAIQFVCHFLRRTCADPIRIIRRSACGMSVIRKRLITTACPPHQMQPSHPSHADKPRHTTG